MHKASGSFLIQLLEPSSQRQCLVTADCLLPHSNCVYHSSVLSDHSVPPTPWSFLSLIVTLFPRLWLSTKLVFSLHFCPFLVPASHTYKKRTNSKRRFCKSPKNRAKFPQDSTSQYSNRKPVFQKRGKGKTLIRMRTWRESWDLYQESHRKHIRYQESLSYAAGEHLLLFNDLS
jgi:hypothetical protein